MTKVSIIGSGNVAQHLIAAFSKSNIELAQVFVRTRETFPPDLIAEKKVVTDMAALEPADIYIIAVSDSAIAEVSKKLPFSGQRVAHTSGTMPIDAIDGKNHRCVFYPLQTFTKGKAVDFRTIPICLEAENPKDLTILESTASAISNSLFRIDSAQRKALHVAAVFVSNFTNHLYAIGEKICSENHIPFEILKPLIAETADKIRSLSPEKAQTGPARRGDVATISAHLDFISDENTKTIYKTLTQSIIDGQKL